jgi:hypothetical protein
MMQAFLTLGLCMKTTRRIRCTKPNKLPIAPPIVPGAASCEYPYAPDVGAACAGRIMIVTIEKGKEDSAVRTLEYFHSICAEAQDTTTAKAVG